MTKKEGKKQDEVGKKKFIFSVWQYSASENSFFQPRFGLGTAGLLCLGNPRYLHIDALKKMKGTWSLSNIRKLN